MSDVTLEELRGRAADIGFTRMSDEHLRQLLRATQAAQARRASLRIETLEPRDEPAHVFRLGFDVVR